MSSLDLYSSFFDALPVCTLDEEPLSERSCIPEAGWRTIEGGLGAVLAAVLGEDEGEGVVLKGR